MKNKKRILMCTEMSLLPTGYSVYSKEVLSRLHQYEDFEVAELACYASANDPRIKQIPWTVFPNAPSKDSPEFQEYKSNPIGEFGEFSFNSIALQFKPDFVFDIRDFWMLSFENTSPFRNFYNWIIMPTVDAEPQNSEWVETYAEADGIFTYSEFGRDTLLKQSNKINFIDVASPCASDVFKPVENKTQHKTSMGIDPNIYIIGTVMRNQRRKLYPNLFKAFRQFLNTTNKQNVFLYCHTTYPDMGWNIPELLLEYGLCNKVLFTYKCKKCNKVNVSFFSDALKFCNHCNTFNNFIAGLNNPISEEELASIYNIFDIYVQYANSEGFGMPQLEAAQCGNVVCSVDYSAMSSVIKNINGIPIKVYDFNLEPETGCKRAIPDNNNFVDILIRLTNLSHQELQNIGMQIYHNTVSHYNWDNTAKKWANYFLNTEIKDHKQTWFSSPKIMESAPINNELISPIDQANFLIANVLCKPDMIGGFLWRRLVKELTYKSTSDNIGSYYFNENHHKDQLKSKAFSFEDAYNTIKASRNYYNTWESHRLRSMEKQ